MTNYSFPGLVTLLTIIFVIAKIWGKLDWSWWLIFSPVWISIGIAIIVIIITLIVAFIVGLRQ
jgi:hypothetical protein